VQIEFLQTAQLKEQASYFKVPGAHLYTVLHQVTDPIARVLLIGPFASERHFSYRPWVRWARYLAARRIEVLRYDYRGVGESTGAFQEMSFENWSEDVQLLSKFISSWSPDVPLMLHGLEIGAILAGRCFHEGTGDALLLWSPPANANQALRSSLLHWAGLGQLNEAPENRRTASQFIEQLEKESLIEVQGYQWSSRLWRDSFHFDLPVGLGNGEPSFDAQERPVRTVKLGKEASPLVKPHFGDDDAKDFTWLYAQTYEWVVEALALPAGGSNEGCD
jgi:Serine aminopeptidase, S33